MVTNNAGDQKEERMFEFMVEQHEIIGHVDAAYEKLRGLGKKWNRFRGATVSNIIAHYLQEHLFTDVKVVKLAYVEGCPTEFDILIVDKEASPADFSDAYPIERVRLLIEVKASGVFYRREDVKKQLSELFEKCKAETGKPIIYLSTWEAKAHIKEVQDALGNDGAFALRVEGGDMTAGEWGEWERFIDRVISIVSAPRVPSR